MIGSRRSALLALAIATLASACHYHRDINAPGVVDPMAPPKDPTSHALEYPDDPGEHLIMLTTGAVGGVFGGSIASDAAVVDLAAEATVSWGDNPTRHNDRESRLFLPRGVLLPLRSTAITLGWSGLRVITAQGRDSDVTTGPLYVEVQRARLFAGVSVGWAFDPATGGTGPQVGAFYTFYFLRGRVLFGDGWELGGGLQLKIPNTWVRSR